MIKNWHFFIGLCLTITCVSCSNKTTGIVTQVVNDETNSMATIISEDNDTLSFSILNIDFDEGQEIRQGDTLEVKYIGKYHPRMAANEVTLRPLSLIGGNRDNHGCLSSAGYTWCAVLNDCIRLWHT